MRWTPRTWLVAIFAVLWLTFQMGVPLVALFTERPERFSWQMFAALSDQPHYMVVREDGEEERVRHSDLLPWVRADVDYPRHFPDYLCERLDGVAIVHVVPRGEEEPTETHRCPRPTTSAP